MNLSNVASRAPSCSAAEWQARQDLACCYRLFDHFGWHELIYNHISVRVPGEDGHFLINPFGLMYREVSASNLVKIDIDGQIVGASDYAVNPAGFVVHSAIHRVRADAHAVAHTHTTAGQAVACQAGGLLSLSFPSLFLHGRLSYHDFEGLTLDLAERERMAANLGRNNAMVLRNHGLLACGPTLADCFVELYQLQRACEVQIAAQAGGTPLLLAPEPVAARASAQHAAATAGGVENRMVFEAMRRWMIDKNPDFLD